MSRDPLEGKIHYLNTDLDLISPVDLAELAEAVKLQGVWVLHVTHVPEEKAWCAIFTGDPCFTEPERSIELLVSAIESLPRRLRAKWNRCTKRDFNLGYSCGSDPWEFNQGLSHDLLRRLVKLGGTLRITIYPERFAESVVKKRATIKKRKSAKRKKRE